MSLAIRQRPRPHRYEEESSSEDEHEQKGGGEEKESSMTSPRSVTTKTSVVKDDDSKSNSFKKDAESDDAVSKEEEKNASNAIVVAKEEENTATKEDDQQEPPSQVSLSQSEDDHIRHLDKSGALNHVVGSQSILTQELNVHDDDEQESPHLHIDSNTYAAAQSMGLLTQESVPQEELDELQPVMEDSQEHAGPLTQEEPPTVVQEEGDEPPSQDIQISTQELVVNSQSSQLSCLMDAAQILEHREEKLASEQLICGENLPQDDKFNFEELEEENDMMQASVKKHTKGRGGKKTCSRLRPPSLPLAYTSNKRKGGASSSKSQPPAFLSPQKRRKLEKEAEQARAQNLAKRAAQLAEQTQKSPEVAKQLLLSMALVRTNPRSAPSTWPPKNHVIPDGFFWGTYPPLENVLRTHMREYYELSTTKCQSRDQQAFNNLLVQKMRAKASQHGWFFDPNRFDDKKLRDRIRCFFKTHIQNAKKRLRTMVRNPTKRANAKALVQHLDLIQQYIPKELQEEEEEPVMSTTDKDTHDAAQQVLALSGLRARV